MGDIWLCGGKVAEQPLVIEEEGVSLYSFEELCFYLFENAGTVEESFFHESLCLWIEEELGEGKLSGVIRGGIAQERSCSWFMEQILSAGGYYTNAQVQQAAHIAERMGMGSPLERLKLRGDRLLRAGRHKDAVLEYQKALRQAGEDAGQDVAAKIWHNMGTAYVKQMLFAQAAECYRIAFEQGQMEESKADYLLARSFAENAKDGEGADGRADAGLQGELLELAARKQAGDRAGYEKMLEEILWRLRAEYRKCDSDGIV